MCRVRCSLCTRWVIMRVPFDLRRWKDHRNSASCQVRQKAALRTSSLGKYGFRPQTKTSYPKNLKTTSPPCLFPCPGLTAKSDSRIPAYLQRCSALGGGARSHSVLSSELCNGLKWRELNADQRRVMLRCEEIEYRWRNSRAIRCCLFN